MSKNVKVFVVVMVLFVLLAAVLFASTTTGFVQLAATGGANLDGFCVGSSAGSCQLGGF